MTSRNKAIGLLAAVVLTAIGAAVFVLSYRQEASRLTKALVEESTALDQLADQKTILLKDPAASPQAVAELDARDRQMRQEVVATAQAAAESISRTTWLLLATRALTLLVLIGAVLIVRRTMDESQRLAEQEKRARADVERQRAELFAVVEMVPAAIRLVNASGELVIENRAAQEFLGELISDGAALPRTNYSVLKRDGREMSNDERPMYRALRGEEVFGEDVVVQSPDGRRTPMLVSAVPMRIGNELAGAVMAFQDITRLKDVDRLKDEFVSIVSHELRTPLTSIRGSLQLVLGDDASVTDPEYRQLLQVAASNCERLIRIINDILDISKIEAGKTSLHPRAVALRDLVTVAIDNVASIARPAGVDVAVSVDPGLPLVLADPDRMVQVLVNLLSNAIKFSPRDSQVSVTAIAKAGLVEVAVQDRGDGIPPEHIERLFQKFEQLESSAVRKKGGTGLGLAIVKGLVEQHGGTIRVESAGGQGARFVFTIPIAPKGTAATPAPSGVAGRSATSGTVLVVDDDSDFRLVVRKQLERAGYVVVEAGDGDEGLRAAREIRPDVITLDLMMPGMNGWQLLRILTDEESLRSIPVIVISAVAEHAGELAREVALMQKPVDIDALITQIRAHGIAHMVKPVDPIELARRVDQLIKPR